MSEQQKPSLTHSQVESILGCKIKTFSLSSFTSEGDNVAGDLFALSVEKQDAKESDPGVSYVYKCFPFNADPQQLDWLIKFKIFRTETAVYEIVFPRLRELLEIFKVDIKLPVPDYVSGFNDDANDYLCLEDLRNSHKMQTKYESLTLQEVKLVLDQIAKFHALTYVLVKYHGERFFEENERTRLLKQNLKTAEPGLADMFAAMTAAFIENSAELLEPRDNELADKLKEFIKTQRSNVKDIMGLATTRVDTKDFACIIHGDLWTNNILFQYKHPSRDSAFALKFVDFQKCRRGTVLEDLGYFFWTSTTPEFRRSHLYECLAVYHNSFASTLEQLKFPGPMGFTLGTLIDGFKDSMLSFYLFMPFALSLQMGDLKQLAKKQEVSRDEPFDFLKSEKTNHYLRMENSPKAMDRLEELTREAAFLNLI